MSVFVLDIDFMLDAQRAIIQTSGDPEFEKKKRYASHLNPSKVSKCT